MFAKIISLVISLIEQIREIIEKLYAEILRTKYMDIV